MEKVARIFRSFAEADQADFEYYQSLTPELRLDILGELITLAQPDETKQRFERVCRIIKLQED
ncbi:MAG: hypothetical protein ACLQAH_06065 [Limisphaerales bacterium]